ncbi:Asp-tRNA(Asn)/Glu-tRNA(Gln) amidotransferase subunit GatB, partial [bacterium]|nr:Asp-tRNA(Asn)/Glu-tRNA(Gln) amidotransferase subunit GatB [bacterium]
MTRETVIGLEVHVQLDTRTKAFCACPNRFGDPPNTNVCPVCLGMPGALPVPNTAAVDMALRLAFALGCAVPDVSVFARKNYFYPDLPKGYQISQFDRPLAAGGFVPIELDGERSLVPLVRAHLEEDAGKSLHDEAAATADSRIDLNRCGTPLVEIVSAPAMSRAEEAAAFLESLRRIVRYLGVSDGDMSRGSLRCDANVSVREPGAPLGTKTEVKNLNSIRMVEKAIRVEAARQNARLDAGGNVEPCTLLWDEKRETVRVMRTKEEADDYRYFPDPDLLPLRIEPARRQRAASAVPELPFARRDRFVAQWGLSEYAAGVLTESRGVADWYEKLAEAAGDAVLAANWTMGEVLRVRKETGGDAFPVEVDALAELLRLVSGGTVSESVAKDVFERMMETGKR